MNDDPRSRPGWADRGLPPELDPRGRGSGRRHASGPPPGGPPPPRPGGSRRTPSRGGRAKQVLSWLAVVTSAAVLLASGTGYVLFRHFNGNINRSDIFSTLDQGPRPDKVATGALNFLLVGIDSRSGEVNSEFQGTGKDFVTGARSDTTILAHISADRDKALLISIPRDSLVDIPSCTDPKTGETSEPKKNTIFNEAFNTFGGDGSPACTVKTVEQNTGVHIDHYIGVDFAAFENMVSALGGVPVCLPEPLQDTKDTVDLPAGRTVLDPEQALGFVRARYGIGDGSDLGRIDRQKQFLSAMISKATSANILLRPDKLYRFLSAVTNGLQVDDDLGSGDLKDLALSLRGLDPSHVTFVTVPLDANPGPAFDKGGKYAGRVVWDEDAARALFASVRTDGPVGGDSVAPSQAPSDLIVPPSDVRVEVLNGFGGKGAAGDAADALRAADFRVTSTGNADDSTYDHTVIRYGSDKADSARTLAAAIPGATLQADASLESTLRVIVGPHFPSTLTPVTIGSASPAATPSPGASPTLDTTTAAAATNCT